MQLERFGFEKLVVWQKSIAYAGEVYDASRGFPADERFGLTAQIRKAAVSVSSNVAEGSDRTSRRDNSHFVEIACGSLMESVSQSFVAKNQTFLPDETFLRLVEQAAEISRMLSGLKASLNQPRDQSR